MDSDEEDYLRSKLINKGKKHTFLLQPKVLEVKEGKCRYGKVFGAALKSSSAMPTDYFYISNEIWHLLSHYVAPEDVQRYALICKQSAATTETKQFWLQLYRKYCQHSKKRKKWILELPDHLQMIELTKCDRKSLRLRVIQALFYCHTPFNQWCKAYNLKKLVGRYYISSWHLKPSESVWIMCYKFGMGKGNYSECSNTMAESTSDERVVAENWESLLEQSSEQSLRKCESSSHLKTSSVQDNNEGVWLLHIYCNRFVPFPSEFLASTSDIRLASTETRISRNMIPGFLQIHFVSLKGDQGVKWKYNPVIQWKVLPWWHPDFNQFNECEF